MPGNPRTAGLREFDRLFRQGTLLGRSEAELLDLFVCSRDEYAFEALVNRHGPMVLRTCRALLADPHDADDAFQATFLVLSRRAGSIRNAKLLGPWLHRVARRVCSRSLADSSRRSRLERPSTDALASLAAPCATLPHADRAALHEAIDLLPERYRRVIILCDLEGHSHAEAAARLRCPIGTVKGRQSRARSLLRRRLTRLGLAPASLLSGTLVSLPTRAFSVPHTLIHRTSRTAATFALGSSLAPGTVPGVALSLATGVLSGMAASQLKFTALVGLLALGLGSSGLAALRYAEDGDGVPGVVSTQTQGTEGERPDDREHAAPAHPADDSVAGLVGTWKLVTRDGGPAIPRDLRLSVSRVEMIDPHNKSVIRCEWTWSEKSSEPGEYVSLRALTLVNPGASPPSWDPYGDWAIHSGIGLSNRGIYRLDGDTLTLRFAKTGVHPRPDDFDGPDTTIYTRVVDEAVVEVAPTPAEDAEGNRPDDLSRASPAQPDDSPDEPRPSPFDQPGGTGGPRRSNLKELSREQLKLLDEVVRVRPEVELLTIEAEVFGELYRERLEDYERMALGLAQRPDDRDQGIALEHALDRIKQQYLDRMSQAADRQTYLRSIESALEGNQRQMDAMRSTVDDHPTLPVESIEHRLSTLEAKLDSLLELLESPDR